MNEMLIAICLMLVFVGVMMGIDKIRAKRDQKRAH